MADKEGPQAPAPQGAHDSPTPQNAPPPQNPQIPIVPNAPQPPEHCTYLHHTFHH